MNIIFLAMTCLAFAVAAIAEIARPSEAPQVMSLLGKAIIEDAGGAVTLAIGLVGVMALFLGLMKVAEAGGLLSIIARLLRPLMHRLFPEVPAGHPAMGAMILNISANVLGLGNAATPFGIRAMQHLDALNPAKGTATNSMVLFLAINTSSVTLLPTSVIALRAAAGSANPAGILPTTLFATICSTAVAIVLAKTLERWWPVPAGVLASRNAPHIVVPAVPMPASEEPTEPLPGSAPQSQALSEDERGYPAWVSGLAMLSMLLLFPLTILFGREIAPWIIPGLMAGLLAFGAARSVRIYESFVEGARDGFRVAVRIIPYLVAILVAVGMLRASGALDVLIRPIGAITAPLGLPVEALLMGMLRALSGSGAYAYLASVLNDPAIGPDSYTGYLVSTIQGSTETTFYVLAVYFGAVGVERMRHAVLVGLTADAAGILASVLICRTLF
jgi:spore maturation protein SpmA